jgi:hypothetical protein
MHSVVRRAAVLALAASLVGSATGCASDPQASPPTGVDELTIPTPSPDPDDFVGEIDNPWLALEPGETSTLTGASGELTLSVGTQPTVLDGVDVTTLAVGDASYLLAQDRDGNVWRFVEGGEPGLFMAAAPRYGDGYYTAYAEGVVEERAEVTALEDDSVEVTTTDPADPAAGTVATYEKGVGLVRLETAADVFER